MGFVAGYGMACMSWVQLFYVCEVGENIQVYQLKTALLTKVQRGVLSIYVESLIIKIQMKYNTICRISKMKSNKTTIH